MNNWPAAATYRLHAPNVPQSAKVARDMVASLLDVSGHAALIDPARLLVSEVVSNVHLHTAVPHLRLAATVAGDGVLVSVEDNDPRGRTRLRAAPGPGSGQTTGGRGLVLVEECASAWGTTWHAGSESAAKQVWFELRSGPR